MKLSLVLQVFFCDIQTNHRFSEHHVIISSISETQLAKFKRTIELKLQHLHHICPLIVAA
jgi:hypothetical protein